MRCIRFAWSVACGVALASQAAAPSPEPKALKIEPRPWSGSPHTRVARIEGTADEKGKYYVLGGLTTLQPVALSVEAKNPGDALTLRVYKQGWKEVRREVSTADQPLAVTEFRTHGEAHIVVASASGPKPFVLRAVVGNEVRRPMKVAFMPMDEYRKRHPEKFSSWRSPWLWGGVALAIAAAAGLAFFLGKRRPS